MLIISENELLHTDTCEDVIEHFGTKGMKWGVRKGKAYAKSFIKYKYNELRHPILTTKGDLKTVLKGKLLNTHRRLDYVNKFVDDRVASKKKYKEGKHTINEKNYNSEQYRTARRKLKEQYRTNKKNSGGNYRDAGRVL
nr:MAG TPA: hypothetical protein [Caudoviricetes sp.]